MKILHFIAGLGRGGAEAMLAKLALGGGTHEHVVLSLGAIGPVGEELAAAGIRVHALNVGRRGRNLSGLFAVGGLIDRERADIVQGWMSHGNLAATAAHWLTRRRSPLLWNIRQSLSVPNCDRWTTRRIIAANARLSGRPAAILYNSTQGALEHEAIGYARQKRRIIPNGFDLERFQPSPVARCTMRRDLGVRDDEILIGLIARFDPWKNHEGFFAAASQLMASQPAIRFLFAGSGMTRENPRVVQLMADPRLAERSLLLGDRSDIPAITNALDIACNVSHGEGFPNTIGEAMACAVPCIVTDAGDCREIVGDAGTVCVDKRPPTIAAALSAMIDLGEQGRLHLGRLARERIEHHYSLSAIVARYDALYEEAAEASAAGR